MTREEFLSAHHLVCGDCDRHDDEPPCEECAEINASLARDLAALLSETRREAMAEALGLAAKAFAGEATMRWVGSDVAIALRVMANVRALAAEPPEGTR